MSTLDHFTEVATRYRIIDNATAAYFRDFMSGVQPDHRHVLIHDPTWIVGFVSGLMYARYRETNMPPERGDARVLHKIVLQALVAMQDVPYTGNSN